MKKILIVDDQAPMVKILTEILKKGNYEIHSASNGQIGIDKAQEILPDLILLDVMMPVKNGLEALVEIRGIEALKNTPIYILTAKGGSGDSQKAMDAGATGFLTKPFSPGVILEQVKKALS